ncbi:HoxN/HupN/NixA family nickel/cobalt transporter [Cellulomonas chengniuliangii]|uniref:Nickel/cobalt efflux system n=1 Tax=Cellulomonas chengniuliangii TaxID=2968084 RepID=A0ABY5KZN4_9CELL|nr:HoxN/HupN/NixA family nickel/cobalt transporter [Cellulomonas chengniuliangii]MCC2309293.1 HoxN/HupN/NixA family nickel/cobalt transporter [Cellulomonas chengniuliangii]UUI75138.1 HoxN/HupN/NixA family nickel/cobalt transporter [Cellulomonas chengniuliangii]
MAERSTASTDQAPGVGAHLRDFRRSLSSADRRSLIGMTSLIAVLHVVGFGLLLGVVAPQHFALGGDYPVYTVGVGILAYTFGLRHAFDADHIAAVDNTTRKLIGDNIAREAQGAGRQKKPLSVGFWFSLGHSTIVFGLAFLLALGVKAIVGPLEDDSSTLHTVTGIIGPSVSGAFLWILGILNLAALVGILKVFRSMRTGAYDEAALEKQLDSRGFMNRFLGGLTKSITKPWQIYPVGVLFGLGFDTATEIGLLVLAGGAAAFNLPFYAILLLPILFAAGMCLMDTLDGVFMNGAYGWAFARPVRKVFYNLTITTISVIVALVIGTIQLVSVFADRFDITTGLVGAIADIGLDYAGYVIVGLFLVSWLVALAVWRFGRVEERWSSHIAG